MLKSRKERRAEARKNNVPFEPQYNSATRINAEGKKVTVGEVKAYEEIYGVGYERFNNKFVTVKELK